MANPAIHILPRMMDPAFRMITIEHVANVLRGAVGAAAWQCVTPEQLVAVLGLTLLGGRDRPGLRGSVVAFDDTAPLETQRYQIARAACAYALQQLGLLRWLSPHDLAGELCDVGSAPRAARRVACLASARARRHSGWIAS